MTVKLNNLVKFRGDRLFNGAVSVDWFLRDTEKSRLAASSFVFHGPQYHGVSQADVGIDHGYRLQDTADFTRIVIRRCVGLEEQPFTLAIAGYGTGKSHLALTLAVLLADPVGDDAESVLNGLESADRAIGGEIRSTLFELGKPCLVVALNGMQNFDLTSEVTQQVARQLRARNLDIGPLDELRPRFSQASNLIQLSGEGIRKDLLEDCSIGSIEEIIVALERQDEGIYSEVHDFFASRGMPIRAFGGESIRDVIDVVSREYCGESKPFGRLLILFDEFGRYTEFATVKSQVAGSGVLQHLFEGVQANADTTCLVGFIQFDLNAYVQRVAVEFRNEILRYVTRYQSASKAYLSINLETLIAHLLEKQDPKKLDAWFDTEAAAQESEAIAANLRKWFPQAGNHQTWANPEQFHRVVRKGCWPLNPLSTWFLYHLASAGKHLQERSALNLLDAVFERIGETIVSDDGEWDLVPVDLWSEDLQQELLTSEESGQHGSITHAYSSVCARHGAQLPNDFVRILRAVILGSKMGLKTDSLEEAIQALASIVGQPLEAVRRATEKLQNEFNVLEWDDTYKEFDILGDSVPRTQFLSFLRQRVSSAYDEKGKAVLFTRKRVEWSDLLGDLECDFAEENAIATKEWRYSGVTSELEHLPTHLKLACDRWKKAFAVDEPRGTVVYCYVEQSRDPESVGNDVAKLVRKTLREENVAAVPVLVVLLCDQEGKLGQALAEYYVLEEGITDDDRARFGNLIGAQKKKTEQLIRAEIERMIKERHYVPGLSGEIESSRISRVGSEIFDRIYKKPLPFPFDGFSTARGNAADSCHHLTSYLLQGRLDYDAILSETIKIQNRAVNVLKKKWDVFKKDGSITTRPKNPVALAIVQKWEEVLQSNDKRLLVDSMVCEACLPPYGANIASAGLLLGVFIAARIDDLVVTQEGQQYALSQWVQNGLFKGKFLDFGRLQGVELVLLGEASSEWDNLLDEWEQAETYFDKIRCHERANDLNERIPVPPTQEFRFRHFAEQGIQAKKTLETLENRENEALAKMEKGYDRFDVALLSWGARDLKDLQDQMRAESALWTIHQFEELDAPISKARQTIISIFPEWLKRQSPKKDTLDAVGEFKNRMLQKVGGNLAKLGLDSQLDELEDRTNILLKKIDTIAEAHQLIRDVRSLLANRADGSRLVRVAEIRDLREIGKGYSSKLQGMTKRVEMTELQEVRKELAEFLGELKEVESDAMKRASHLWKSNLRSEEDLDDLRTEIENLLSVFEGCERDLDDLRVMRRALENYRRDYRQLNDARLGWLELERLAERLCQESQTTIEEDEIPWPVVETLRNFVEEISARRQRDSVKWIEAMKVEASGVSTMSAVEANRLHAKAESPPPFLTDAHMYELARITERIETRLASLALNWLIEKFKELPGPVKREFLDLATQLLTED